jgi:hypothetical protein
MTTLKSVSMMSESERRHAYEAMEEAYPDLWRKCYPRTYQSSPKCGDYYSPKEPARWLLGISLKWLQGFIGQAERYEFISASNLARFNVPTYWLGKDIAAALRHTAPPGELDWYDMPLPFDACVFMLPKGTLVHPDEGNVTFVAYSRLKAGEYRTSDLGGSSYGSVNGGMTFLAHTEYGHITHWNMPLDAYGGKLTLPEMDTLMQQYSVNKHSTGFWQGDKAPQMTPADDVLGIEVAHLIFGAILLMEDRPELITRGSLQKRVLAKKGKPEREFWSPNVLGEFYRIKREAADQGGTHASPRFHWVRGYYRQQPYGEGRKQHRRTWIEPFTRG